MEPIKVSIDEVLCDRDMAKQYAAVINGIAWDCLHNHGFEQGWRNTIAVDLTVAAFMLGLEPTEVLDKMVEGNVINLDDDDEDTYVRVRNVEDYSHNFDWDYMLHPDVYLSLGEIHDDEPFVVVS